MATNDDEEVTTAIELDEKTDPAIQLVRPGAVPTPLRPIPPSARAVQNSATISSSAAAAAPTAPATAVHAVKMPDLNWIDGFMRDPAVTEIMVNDLRNVMIERDGKVLYGGVAIPSMEELSRLTRNILDATGKTLSPDHPFVDAILPDGSRVNIVGPPLTAGGPCITIRKFPTRRYSLEDLTQLEMMTSRMAYFLNACVLGRMNILVSGGTGGGKTTLLNALATKVGKAERIVTIEDTYELVVPHPNSVRLHVKPQTSTSPAITARDLLANALRMRPDRIIVGECRRGEAFDMLQAMNTGHNGSMTSIHANSPRDALTRLETLCMLSGVEVPLSAIRRQIASAIDLIVQIKRFRNGRRRIIAISEVTGMESDIITMQDVYLFDERTSSFAGTGLVPSFLDRLRENGIELPKNFFS